MQDSDDEIGQVSGIKRRASIDNDGNIESLGDMDGQGKNEDLLSYGMENEDEGDKESSIEDLNQQELDAIVESITSGKSQSHKKLQFQAFCAAISHEDQVRFVIDYLDNSNNNVSTKFATAKNRIFAYRVNQIDQISQKEVIAEGFDDDGEDGTGEKLLNVLQKMDIDNIMIIVCVWNSGVTIGENRLRGGEFFGKITDRARELLIDIKDGLMEDQNTQNYSPNLTQRQAQQIFKQLE